MFEPRLQNRRVLISSVNNILESDILLQMNKDFSNLTCFMTLLVLIYILLHEQNQCDKHKFTK